MSDNPPNDSYQRPFDIALLVAAHILLLPVWVVLWTAVPLAIWLGDRGHVLYGQTRLGKDGRPFTMLKFRTMVVEAESGAGRSMGQQPGRAADRGREGPAALQDRRGPAGHQYAAGRDEHRRPQA